MEAADRPHMNVESFNLDHRAVAAPYLRVADRKALPGGDVLTKIDVRFCQPNVEHLEMPVVHSLEHLVAEHSRNHTDAVVDFSPMGCQTGFYLLLAGDWAIPRRPSLVAATLRDVLEATEVPAANEVQCGWGANHTLAGAKDAARDFLAGATAGSGDGVTAAIVVVAMAAEAEPFLARADRVGRRGPTSGTPSTSAIDLGGSDVLLVRSGIGLVARPPRRCGRAARVDGAPLVVSAGQRGRTRGRRARRRRRGRRALPCSPGADATAFGYALGQVPGMPAFYEGAPAQVEAARGARLADGVVHVGTMLSGDSFVDARTVERRARRLPLRAEHRHGDHGDRPDLPPVRSPFVGVRGISDLCGPVAGEDFRTHVDDAADRSAEVVLALLGT